MRQGEAKPSPGEAPADGGTIVAVARLSRQELEDGLAHVCAAPAEMGALELIARRPVIEAREILAEAKLDRDVGLVGDIWSERPSSKTGAPNPEAQVTVMSARAVALFADSDDAGDWAQAGDQLYVDLDLSEENLPAGARLEIGEAVLEVSADPHLGCGKFIKRFGPDAMKLVNSEEGRALRLRGVNTRVVVGGTVRLGDVVRRVGKGVRGVEAFA